MKNKFLNNKALDNSSAFLNKKFLKVTNTFINVKISKVIYFFVDSLINIFPPCKTTILFAMEAQAHYLYTFRL